MKVTINKENKVTKLKDLSRVDYFMLSEKGSTDVYVGAHLIPNNNGYVMVINLTKRDYSSFPPDTIVVPIEIEAVTVKER